MAVLVAAFHRHAVEVADAELSQRPGPRRNRPFQALEAAKAGGSAINAAQDRALADLTKRNRPKNVLESLKSRSSAVAFAALK